MSSPPPPPQSPVRIAVRGVVIRDGKLLLVNAWKGHDRLWCAPGGGVQPHSGLPDNLQREIHEETGLTVAVGTPCLVNEFHDPASAFHQIDIYFRCTLLSGDPDGDWTDPEGIVSFRKWVTPSEMAGLTVKPDSLATIAWQEESGVLYDPLEPLVRG